MATRYVPGLWAVALGNQSGDVFDDTDMDAFLSRSEESTHTPDIQMNVREYERFHAWAAVDLVPGTRVDRFTLRGDVDTKEVSKILKAMCGTPVSGVYTHGGLIGSAANKLSMVIAKGRVDGDPGPDLQTKLLRFHTCRMESLAFFLDEPESQWKFEAGIIGIYHDNPLETIAGAISFPATNLMGKLLNKGGTLATNSSAGGSYTPRRLISLRINLLRAADPMFTTIAAADKHQATDFTVPTDFEDGALGATIDLMSFAKHDDGIMLEDFLANNLAGWTILAKSKDSTHSLQFAMPISKYSVANIDKNGKRNQRQRATAIGLYTVDGGGLTVTLDNT